MIEILKPLVISHASFTAGDIVRYCGRNLRRDNPNPKGMDADHIDYRATTARHFPHIHQTPHSIRCSLYGSHGITLIASRATNVRVHESEYGDGEILQWEDFLGVPLSRKIRISDQQ
ncbi:hypothetical protein OVA24_06430 [Luteolibacter sp. SL250]|uniref:hypothetical protein n=1 Tax=Luteolibacter sp. SL250 TaxID=2995170 RepID=UPI00226FAA69|nr:hypothetical protein [Luteolibacter sp. SL250]WAC21018.1 hypothetical protein OVA24_06430 [Luteolibacter sp. SL250]